MLQRIQTLFLLAATGLVFSLILTPMIKFTDGVTVIRYIEYYPTLIITLVSFVLSIVTIVSFKKLVFQMRLCVLNALILTGMQALILFKFFTREPEMIFSITAVFPIAAAIFLLLALRYIGRDHSILYTSSRLRGGNRGGNRRKRRSNS